MAVAELSSAEKQIQLDAFVARIMWAGSRCRGDSVQAETYSKNLRDLTAGKYGHITAAASGDSLACKVLSRLEALDNPLTSIIAHLSERLSPGSGLGRITRELEEILDSELIPYLGDVSLPTKKMICDQVIYVWKDIARGPYSNAAQFLEEMEKERIEEKRRWYITRVIDLINALGSFLKSLGSLLKF